MKRESAAERSAWTAHIEGTAAPKPNKYGAVRTNGYASRHESEVAASLAMLQGAGHISDLREQVSYVLVQGNGKIRPIIYKADFVFRDDKGAERIYDAKGYTKDKVYRLKKKLLLLLHGLIIEEV